MAATVAPSAAARRASVLTMAAVTAFELWTTLSPLPGALPDTPRPDFEYVRVHRDLDDVCPKPKDPVQR
jgi:hypothetical protein